MSYLKANDMEAAEKGIKELYPDIDWTTLEEADRALNWELYWGPLPSDYWTVAEPLEHYVWSGWTKACDDIREILDPLDQTMWYDPDSGCVTDKNPEDFEEYWLIDEDEDTAIWIGGEWYEINPVEIVLHVEVFKQLYR